MEPKLATEPYKDERKESITMDDELQTVVDYIKNCKDKNKLNFIREMTYAHDSELRAEEMLKNKPKSKLTGKDVKYEDDED